MHPSRLKLLDCKENLQKNLPEHIETPKCDLQETHQTGIVHMVSDIAAAANKVAVASDKPFGFGHSSLVETKAVQGQGSTFKYELTGNTFKSFTSLPLNKINGKMPSCGAISSAGLPILPSVPKLRTKSVH
jgi:hypothetical protein